MCGITGLYQHNNSAPVSMVAFEATIMRMTATLAHRGPDALGHEVIQPIAFGHRRLSILDISEAGAQPMRLGKAGPIITFNGEVYNFKQLRDTLNGLGHTEWRGNSDTEVILRAYAQWGLDGLKQLEGIFALALWDPPLNRLVLMRDRLGVKPLYFGESRFGLAFGSEIKAVLAAGAIDTSLDDQAFSEYLWYGNSYEDRTFYRGVRALSPGHWLLIDKSGRKIGPWWRIEEWIDAPVTARNITEASQQVKGALDASVSRQLVADVPIGIFLSGGVDSSAIAASASKVSDNRMTSYAAGFDFDGGVNELPKAKSVADFLGLDHHELRVSGGDLQKVLLTLARAHDEPFADAANIPLYLMCRELSGKLKVVLQGDGGDEMFAGYRRYAVLRNTQWWHLWPQGMNKFARKFGHVGRRFVRMAETLGNTESAMRMALLLTVETLHDAPEYLLNEDRRRELLLTTDPFKAYRNAAQRFGRHDPVQQMLLTDITVQLPSQFLTKVDRATMAAGIEARVPLLDELIAGLVVGMPSHWKAHGMEKKVVLRAAMRGRLPDAVLDGPKTGFGVPYENWLRTSLYDFARERLLNGQFLEAFSFKAKLVEEMLENHRSQKRDRGFLIWKLLQLALWKEVAA